MSVLHSILSVLNVKALVGAFNVQPGEGPHGFNERVGYEDALVLGLDEGGECGWRQDWMLIVDLPIALERSCRSIASRVCAAVVCPLPRKRKMETDNFQTLRYMNEFDLSPGVEFVLYKQIFEESTVE